MIGADMRIDGNITFTGVLRIQGSVTGDISSDGIVDETLVTDTTGRLKGSIEAPHVVVRGHISGPVRSSQTIQVQPGASLLGDVYYKEIEIQAGGVVEGVLAPVSSIVGDRQQHTRRRGSSSLEISRDAASNSRITERVRLRHIFGSLLVLCVVVVPVLWLNQDSRVVEAITDGMGLTAGRSTKAALIPLASQVDVASSQDRLLNASSDQRLAVATTGNASVSGSPDQTAAKRPDKNDSEEVVAVQGVNPVKPGDFIWVSSDAPAVLVSKTRPGQTGDEHIDVPPGKKISIPVAEGQLFRVVEGQHLEILYQGRKVGPRTISSGAWIRFVPYSRKGGDTSHQN